MDYTPIRFTRILLGIAMTVSMAIMPLGAALMWRQPSASSVNSALAPNDQTSQVSAVAGLGIVPWVVLATVFLVSAVFVAREVRRPTQL